MERLSVTARSICRDFSVEASVHESTAAGTVFTLFSKQWLGNAAVSSTEFSKGRVLRSAVTNSRGTLVVWNVHNFELSQEELKKFQAKMKKSSSKSQVSQDASESLEV